MHQTVSHIKWSLHRLLHVTITSQAVKFFCLFSSFDVSNYCCSNMFIALKCHNFYFKSINNQLMFETKLEKLYSNMKHKYLQHFQAFCSHILPYKAYFNNEELLFHTWSTKRTILRPQHNIRLLHFTILIYNLDFYLVPAYTTPMW